jgi:hypothetical protein
MNSKLVEKAYHEAIDWCVEREKNLKGERIAWSFEEKFAEIMIRETLKVVYHVINQSEHINGKLLNTHITNATNNNFDTYLNYEI